jgi:hypothetical protein
MKAHVVKGQVPLLFFLLAAHFSEAVAAAARWATRNPLLLPVVLVLGPWLARELVSSSIMYSPWFPA